MGNIPTNNRLSPPTHLVNLKKSSAGGEPFARNALSPESCEGGSFSEGDRLDGRRTFPTRYLEGGLLTKRAGGVELQDGHRLGKGRVLGLPNLRTPCPAQGGFGGKVDGGGIE